MCLLNADIYHICNGNESKLNWTDNLLAKASVGDGKIGYHHQNGWSYNMTPVTCTGSPASGNRQTAIQNSLCQNPSRKKKFLNKQVWTEQDLWPQTLLFNSHLSGLTLLRYRPILKQMKNNKIFSLTLRYDLSLGPTIGMMREPFCVSLEFVHFILETEIHSGKCKQSRYYTV